MMLTKNKMFGRKFPLVLENALTVKLRSLISRKSALRKIFYKFQPTVRLNGLSMNGGYFLYRNGNLFVIYIINTLETET